jgi:TRAP-type C4-dicarboxylate transport system substrate-binding protein
VCSTAPIGHEILKSCEIPGLRRPRVLRLRLALDLHDVKKPVKTLADTKGMKIRVQQSGPLGGAAAGDGRERHAHPISARSTRRSRPAWSTPPRTTTRRYETARHYEVAKYYNDHRALDGARDAADVSKKVWDGLTPEEQKRSSALRRQGESWAVHAHAVGR